MNPDTAQREPSLEELASKMYAVRFSDNRNASEWVTKKDAVAFAREVLEQAAQIAESFAEEIHYENAGARDVAEAIRKLKGEPK